MELIGATAIEDKL